MELEQHTHHIQHQTALSGAVINNIGTQNNFIHNEEKSIKFYEKDIKDIILCFARVSDDIISNGDGLESLDALNLPEKNEINNLPENYFNQIVDKHMKYFNKIETFLKYPRNGVYSKMYENTASDLNFIISSCKEQFDNFGDILIRLYQYILYKNENELRLDRDLIYVFLHYMYCHCDIGDKIRKEGNYA